MAHWTGIVRIIENEVTRGADGKVHVSPPRPLKTFNVTGESVDELRDKARAGARKVLGDRKFTVSMSDRDEGKRRQKIVVTSRKD